MTINRVYKTFLDIENGWNNEWFPDNLQEAIKWLQSKFDEIPEEFRENAKLEVSATMNYDSPVPTMEISSWRYETPEETAKREEIERRRMERLVLQAVENELATYEALKRKYG